MKVERKFEEEWKDAFDGAEVTPSDAVWTGIDLELANAEGSSMKRRVVFYQRIAAASVLFALLVGGFGFYRWKETERLATEKNNSKTVVPEITARVAPEKNSVADLNKKKTDQNEITSSATITKNQNTSAIKKEEEVLANSHPNPNTDKSFVNSEKGYQPIAQPPQITTLNQLKVQPTQSLVEEYESVNQNNFNTQQSNYNSFELAAIPEAGLLPIIDIEGEPVKEELVRKLPAIPGAFMIVSRHSKINHEHLWASVTAAAGNYSTVANANSVYSNSAYNSSVQSNASVNQGSGSSYTYGMLAGMRISNRIVIQSGVQYSNQTIGTTTNINAPSSLDAVANFTKSSTAAVSYSSPYTINSANEFISVPVQAGYLFIDRKIGLQVNSGISTDFFVRNTLSDPSGLRQSYSQSAGQDSPYRSVNFSGLMSSEVSYKLGRHYRLSLVPGMRYSVAPVLKSSVGSSTGNNMVWDIGFRFRYIFK